MSAAKPLTEEVTRAIAATLTALHPAGDIWEIRAPEAGRRGTASGYYSDPEQCARDVVAQLDGKAPAIYLTLNRINPELLARSANRLQERAKSTTSDTDVTQRLWLPFDFDPDRPTGISSNDIEHAEGLARAAQVAMFLRDLDWPDPLQADSGNGGHLLYPIALPNDKPSELLVKRTLEAIKSGFDEPTGPRAARVHLDTSVSNAARIWKLYGTMTQKGDNVPALDRIHRRSRLLSVPSVRGIVTPEQMEELCEIFGQVPSSETSERADRTRNTPGWVEDAGAYLHDRGIGILHERTASNARKWVLESCVWNPAHTDHSAWVMQFTSNGAIAAGCSHNSCQGKRWPDFRDAVEPGWRSTYRIDTPAISDGSKANARNARNAENSDAKGNSAFLAFSEYASESRDEQTNEQDDHFPKAEPAMFYGIAGDIVGGIEPHTEASPVALLVQLLVCIGNAAGRHAYYLAEADRHYPNLYALIVGDTAKARKGTSWGHVARVMRQADPLWEEKHIVNGLSSGEGIIHTLRNVAEADIPRGDEGELLRDKRLLAREGEFASVLAQKARDGNILSMVLRDGWDGAPLGALTKHSPERASNTHLSAIGHITQAELIKQLSNVDALNGYANRFLFVATKRARLLPHGGDLEAITKATEEPIEQLRKALIWARDDRKIAHDAKAFRLWEDEMYERLSAGSPGLFGAVTARAEAQVTRLALIYALLDCSRAITEAHLQAAMAVWKFCEDSARFIFGDRLGDSIADRVLEELRAAPDGLTRTQVYDLFDHNVASAKISAALALLQTSKLAVVTKEPTGEKGRPPERWKAVDPTQKTQ